MCLIRQKPKEARRNPLYTYLLTAFQANSSDYTASYHAPFLPWTAFIIAQQRKKNNRSTEPSNS